MQPIATRSSLGGSRRWPRVGAWVLAGLLGGACGHGARGKAEPGSDAVEHVRGGRRAGPKQGVVDDAPRADGDERTPFGGDRFGLGAQRVREDLAHDQHHRRRRARAADAGPSAR
ncbi:MAG: hypothetical protein IPL40_03260 [Proteobacteria bacterium]|nr:hypothetical protein [Pseudomonadota bacterium]